MPGCLRLLLLLLKRGKQPLQQLFLLACLGQAKPLELRLQIHYLRR